MEFERLLEILGNEPVFETSLLLAGDTNPGLVRLQLNRWSKSGKIYRLRRGVYALAPPYQKTRPHPFLIANSLQRVSYVSLQSALSYYGLIPEAVPITLSVTTRRPERLDTPLGSFEYRHVRPDFLRGYRMLNVANTALVQQALVATPEKALLDLVYLQPGGDASVYLGELRLQNLSQLDLGELQNQAAAFHSPKLRRAVEQIVRLAQAEAEEYETL